jgi:hypothetical protein
LTPQPRPPYAHGRIEEAPVNGDQANRWAERIRSAWQESLSSIIKCGRLPAEAKASLPHGHFEAMVENELPFEARTAQMLMKIAADQRLTNANYGSLLPPPGELCTSLRGWMTSNSSKGLRTAPSTRKCNEKTLRGDRILATSPPATNGTPQPSGSSGRDRHWAPSM